MPDSFPTPDSALFSVNARENQFEIRFRVEAEFTLTVEAASLEEANAKADAFAAEGEHDFSEFTDRCFCWLAEVDVASVAPEGPMYRVLRDGRRMQVSRLEPGDQPRQPDERGF